MANQHKVYAYVTHGTQLLVFSHTWSPEAGIQVPGGSVKLDESPHDAVMREVFEESGLAGWDLIAFLGETRFRRASAGSETIVSRRFYHLRLRGMPPSAWRHWETDPSERETTPIPFDFFWIDLSNEIPALAADLGKMIPQLLSSLTFSS